jgi:hypothetical protein
MPIDTNFSNNLKDFAEGRLDSTNYKQPQIPGQVFVRMIVMDVISDANTLPTDDQKRTWQTMGVRNMQYVDVLPRNTILAKKLGEDVGPMFCFPFFPSHLALPCKPGECVWVMFEKPDAGNSEMAFWMCKIVEPHVVDDVNHTHPGRSFETSFNPGTKERANNEKQGTAATGDSVWHELRNGPVVKIGNKRQTAVDNILLRGEKEDIFELLVTNSNASKLMTYESVPRFSKRPGDVVLEGSNNSLVVLGTDRKNAVTKSEGEFPAGSIDIVAGRGQTEKTFGKQTTTTQMKGATETSKGPEIKKELNKVRDVLSQEEGNPDFMNDRSRILVSQRSSVDQNFGLKDFNQTELDKAVMFNKQKIEDSPAGDAGIVIKSDKVRLIARSDVEIIVSGYQERNSPNGTKIKDQNQEASKWAAIVIKKNGDIVLRPADEGYLKLGGDDADLAILCSQAMPGPAGQVKGTPIVDTMGGTLGAEGALPTGQFSKKVLIK